MVGEIGQRINFLLCVCVLSIAESDVVFPWKGLDLLEKCFCERRDAGFGDRRGGRRWRGCFLTATFFGNDDGILNRPNATFDEDVFGAVVGQNLWEFAHIR